jgi:hypothetical protein
MYETVKAKLENFQVGTDLEKAKLENSPEVNQFVDLLIRNPSGWLFVKKWIEQKERTPLLVVNSDFNAKNIRDNLLNLVNTHYLRRLAFDFLYWIDGLDENQANQMNNFLLELLHNGLLIPKKEMLCYCPSCGLVSLTLLKNLDSFTMGTCQNCKGIRLRQILSSTLKDEIKRSIWNGQLLEIYAHKILKKEGVKFIGGHANGYECFTSIRYNTPHGEGEVDCIGIVRNTIIFIETKMTALNLTDFKKENETFDGIFEKLAKEIHNLNKLKAFIAFRIDKNIDIENCRDCHFINLYEEGNIAENIIESVLKTSSQETIEDYLKDSKK